MLKRRASLPGWSLGQPSIPSLAPSWRSHGAESRPAPMRTENVLQSRTDTPAPLGASMKSKLRSSIAVNEAYFILKNLKQRLRQTFRRDSLTDEFTQATDPEERAKYALRVFGEYVDTAGLDADSIAGLRVLEVGPGDNLGSAFLFAAHGAEVATLDAFRVTRAETADVATSVHLMKQTGRDATAAPAILDGIDCRYGTPLERATDVFPHESFDLIVSCAVLEHVRSIEVALGQADMLLRPGGCQVHFVDLRDHGMFTPGGIHELAFLGVGDSTWRLMTENLALPNRSRISRYDQVLAALNYSTQWSVSHVLGISDPLKPTMDLADLLALPLRSETTAALSSLPAKSRRVLQDAPLEDWIVQVFAVACQKPQR
jgi:2-polyprenyl-3-methyl-5-hydroxy-6-metoxy-1,4-benzoquinol methylase